MLVQNRRRRMSLGCLRALGLDPSAPRTLPPAARWARCRSMLYICSPISPTRWLQRCGHCKHSLLRCLLSRSRQTASGRKIEEMPQHLQFNPWIRGGYRAPELSTLQCIKSIGGLHNETVNILTHGLPILYVLFNCVQLFALHKLPCYLTYCHMISCLCPWLGSFVYHVFMNHKAGEALYVRLLQADMAGIWFTQTFGALTTLNASFMAGPDMIRRAFLTLYLCLACTWTIHRGFTARSSWQRALSFAPMVAMRAIALATRLATSQLVPHSSHLTHVLNQELLPILGAFISATRIPERFFPGLFDLALNSHNIMHCLVVAGGIHMHLAFLYDIEIVRTGPL